MSQHALKRIRLHFRDRVSDVEPFDREEPKQWEHVASYSMLHHSVEDDAGMIHIFRRSRTADASTPGHSEGVADPRRRKGDLRERLAEINRKNAEFWKDRQS